VEGIESFSLSKRSLSILRQPAEENHEKLCITSETRRGEYWKQGTETASLKDKK
jgi:hypothetical protein